ncbi:MAG: hypothetical protein KDK61_07640, partial [Simkania sp.]|nr:hypothetical protein [Simkania sp.]
YPGIWKVSQPSVCSIEFYREDVQVVLQKLAEIGGINLLCPSQLQGEMTIKLSGFNWRRTIQEILQVTHPDYLLKQTQQNTWSILLEQN